MKWLCLMVYEFLGLWVGERLELDMDSVSCVLFFWLKSLSLTCSINYMIKEWILV